MVTDGGAILEDGRVPYGSHGDFGKRLGEWKGFCPDAVASAARCDHREQKDCRGTLYC